MIVAIEGIDGSGKGSQTKLVTELARGIFSNVQSLSFPRYGLSKGAKLVELYLNGKLTAGLNDYLGPAMFFALDRFETKDLLQKYSKDPSNCLIIDRYVASNVAHQSCKELDKEKRFKIQTDIVNIEHEILEIPRPDVVIYFEIEPALAQQRVTLKSARGYTEKTHDLHEGDLCHLINASHAFNEIFKRGIYENVIRIMVEKGRSVEHVFDETQRLIKPFFSRKSIYQ